VDAYKVNIFRNGSKLKVCAKLVNLNVNYNYVLAKVGVNLVTLVNELKSSNFLVLMSLKVS
jgi:hypothetical protein